MKSKIHSNEELYLVCHPSYCWVKQVPNLLQEHLKCPSGKGKQLNPTPLMKALSIISLSLFNYTGQPLSSLLFSILFTAQPNQWIWFMSNLIILYANWEGNYCWWPLGQDADSISVLHSVFLSKACVFQKGLCISNICIHLKNVFSIYSLKHVSCISSKVF